MSKYETLLNILDQLRKEAPQEYKRYYPLENDIEGLNNARSRAYIHLFLKVKFGILDFKKREELIADGPQDGGIDAYYIDNEAKCIYFIQAKFRTNESNFNNREILLKELLQMEVNRIISGEGEDEKKQPYNNKIKRLIEAIKQITDIARYKYEVIILANLTKITPQQLKTLTGGNMATVFDYERTYTELVFPVVVGTYYDPGELKIWINLSNTGSSNSKISYTVNTHCTECDITVLFVPTIEIARALYQFKNSILKFNPRSYLELSSNEVNRDIAKTITDLDTNEFALYNNGITILSYGTAISERIGQRQKGQLIITQPQIINGGQTAYTLSLLYENSLATGNAEDLFGGKEVLLKVITMSRDNIQNNTAHLALIEKISKATNQQSPVDEADRRSNDSIQIQLQEKIFDAYGYFYERKRGEYADGLRAGYIRRNQIIDRELFLRLCKSCDLRPTDARRTSRKKLFSEEHFPKTLSDISRFREYFFAYKCYEYLSLVERKFSKDKNNRFGIANYGYGLRYGKFALVSACMLSHNSETELNQLESIVDQVLSMWLDFEAFAIALPGNSTYFRIHFDEQANIQKQELNFDNYYKGSTLKDDLLSFFKKDS